MTEAYQYQPDIVTINIQPNVKVVAACLVIAIIVSVIALILQRF